MTKRLVGAVGTSSAACPRRGGRVLCVHGDGSVHAPSRHLTPISTAVTTTQKGTCKMVGSPFHVAATTHGAADMQRGQPQAEEPGPRWTAVRKNRRNVDDTQIPRVVQRTQGGIEPSLRPPEDVSEMFKGHQDRARGRRRATGHGRKVVEDGEVTPQTDRQAHAEDVEERAAGKGGDIEGPSRRSASEGARRRRADIRRVGTRKRHASTAGAATGAAAPADEG